ncbi:hypothetical protein [Coralliovum pocilloporae]|uniref:hypothetical protein n=1 Tax=Coralliovum pocilloporae TaxID=3066369 RepID=UPI003307851E
MESVDGAGLLTLSDGRVLSLADVVPRPGVNADMRLEGLLKPGQAIRFRTFGKDRYGRLIAHIALTGRQEQDIFLPDSSDWLQALLVRMGAYLVMPDSGSACAEVLARLSDNNRTGLMVITTRNARKVLKTERFDSFIVKVNSAHIRSNRVYINSSRDWSRDFSVTVEPGAYAEFLKRAEISLLGEGDYIKVTGWVRRWNGTVIHVTHPAQLRFLGEDR